MRGQGTRGGDRRIRRKGEGTQERADDRGERRGGGGGRG